jgi:hypothetical protein
MLFRDCTNIAKKVKIPFWDICAGVTSDSQELIIGMT